VSHPSQWLQAHDEARAKVARLAGLGARPRYETKARAASQAANIDHDRDLESRTTWCAMSCSLAAS
jgi:hypothetical protein